MQLADELLSTALVDTANAACYTLPAEAGCACASEDAAAAAEDWDTRVGAALPGTVTPHRDAGRRHRAAMTVNDRLDRPAIRQRSPSTADGGHRCALKPP
jgi:hypothetical protein